MDEKSTKDEKDPTTSNSLEKNVVHRVCIAVSEVSTQVGETLDFVLIEVTIGKEIEHFLFVPKIISLVKALEEVLLFNSEALEEELKQNYDSGQPWVLA